MKTLSNLVREKFDPLKSSYTIEQLNNEAKYSFSEIHEKIKYTSQQLKSRYGIQNRLIGLAMSSSADLITSDLAILLNGGISLPVPLEFTDDQIEALLKNADYVIVNDDKTATRLKNLIPNIGIITPNGDIYQQTEPSILNKYRWKNMAENGVIKIIHTSGTTSSPKGVMITDSGLGQLISILLEAHKHIGKIRYLSLVPFSLLIEQVLGLYLPFLSGGSTYLLPFNVPPFGSQLGSVEKYIDLLASCDSNLLFLPPKLIEEIEKRIQGSQAKALDIFSDEIPHILTGGAKIDCQVLKRLESMGISVYEAYGLSENSSIVSMNTIDHQVLCSQGKVLPNIKFRFVDNELQITGPALSPGYVSTDDTALKMTIDGFLHTGDLGYVDKNNFLHITGRKKHVIILSNSRNISAEWAENIFKQSTKINDIVIFGEGKDSLSAIIIPEMPNTSQDDVAKEVSIYNKHLPSFAEVTDYLLISDAENFRNHYYTVTGRPKRKLIEKYFEENYKST